MTEQEKNHLNWCQIVFDRCPLAEKTWDWIKVLSPGVPVPAACTGPDDQFIYCWDKGRHHFEVEVFTDGRVEFFYADRDIENNYWGHDANLYDSIPDNVLEYFNLFRA